MSPMFNAGLLRLSENSLRSVRELGAVNHKKRLREALEERHDPGVFGCHLLEPNKAERGLEQSQPWPPIGRVQGTAMGPVFRAPCKSNHQENVQEALPSGTAPNGQAHLKCPLHDTGGRRHRAPPLPTCQSCPSMPSRAARRGGDQKTPETPKCRGPYLLQTAPLQRAVVDCSPGR